MEPTSEVDRGTGRTRRADTAYRKRRVAELDIEKQARARYDEGRKLRDKREAPKEQEKDTERKKYRENLACNNRAVVFERHIGESDLLRVNYLERGLRASRAVCRIDVRNVDGTPVASGTGFLISPRLLMTNAHVLLDEDEGNNSFAEFDFEDDVNSLPKERIIFKLNAKDLMVRDREHDLAVVAVEPTDIRGEQSLSQFGYIQLRATSGKALTGERVSIIQHPDGRSKEIACRANKVLRRRGIFIHYEADTDKGSSGSPVFSDEWEVVALHHAGVRKTNDAGDVLNKSGGIWDESQPEEDIKWEANEGIRISEIITFLRDWRNKQDSAAKQKLVDDAIRQPDLAARPYVTLGGSVDEERRDLQWYAQANGYDEDFFGFAVPLPDSSSHPDASEELEYRNFSVVMHRGRRQALYTACNIDGQRQLSGGKSPGWKKDPRLGGEFQLGNEFYKNQAGRKNLLDKGHLVKRTDPRWGDIGLEAVEDTYHYTNAALQHRDFNNGIWGRLEDALEARFDGRTIMNVYTGPVFRDNDPEVVVTHSGEAVRAQIPLAYWKVIAFADADGFFATAGFIQSQAAVIRNMDSDFTDETTTAELITQQVSIRDIEVATGLGFHDFREFEASETQLESTRRWRRNIRTRDDFLLEPSRTRRPTRLVRGGNNGA